MKCWRSEQGQGLVEFALVVSLLMILVMGIVETGRFLHHLLILRHATYDLVRAASVGTADAPMRNRALQHVRSVVPSAAVMTDWYTTDPTSGSSVYAVRFSDNGDDQWVEMRLLPDWSSRVQGGQVSIELRWGYRPIFVGAVQKGPAVFTLDSFGRVESAVR